MRAWVRSCPGAATPAAVFRRLVDRARRRGLPPPAALIGDWFGGGAVLAPTVTLEPVWDRDTAFATPARQPEVVDGAPRDTVGGGWFGYLGFGLADPGWWNRRLPRAAWGWADHVLRQDADGRWWFEALLDAGRDLPTTLAAELAELVRTADAVARPATPPTGPAHWPLADQHSRAVGYCLDAITDGEIYQANVCVRVELPPVHEPAELFAGGVAAMAPARAVFLGGSWGAVASFSPELFLSRHGRAVTSRPIKGTRPLTAPPEELQRSAKDRAENIMITDMVRNDLGRVAVTGSVRVPELLAVCPAPGVWHLVSTVTAELRAGLGDAELLAATFPPASVTGTPKLRALELLAQWERLPREVYCGAIGMASPLAGLELAVAIRTVEVGPDGTAWLGVGGGITIDSDADEEWQECVDKAAAILELLSYPKAPMIAPATVRETT